MVARAGNVQRQHDDHQQLQQLAACSCRINSTQLHVCLAAACAALAAISGQLQQAPAHSPSSNSLLRRRSCLMATGALSVPAARILQGSFATRWESQALTGLEGAMLRAVGGVHCWCGLLFHLQLPAAACWSCGLQAVLPDVVTDRQQHQQPATAAAGPVFHDQPAVMRQAPAKRCMCNMRSDR